MTAYVPTVCELFSAGGSGDGSQSLDLRAAVASRLTSKFTRRRLAATAGAGHQLSASL